MFIPGHERYTDMTPEEFEKYSLKLLQDEADKLENSIFEHNVKMHSHDGNYQIDGKISFSHMGLTFMCLVECKRYKGPIKREQISALLSKMQSLGAQKGIFITTSYYQTGAIQFAKAHGIALLTITDEGITHHTRSCDMIDIHMPTSDGTFFVSVLTEAIEDDSYRNSFLRDKSCSALRDFLLRT